MLIASFVLAASVFVPPVPKGIQGTTTLGTTAIPFPKEKQSWIRVRTPLFDVVSSAGETKTREMASSLEMLAAALRQVNPRYAGPQRRTRVFFFARRGDVQPYFDVLFARANADVSGVFVAQPDGTGTMIIDAGRAWLTRTPFHELIHSLLAQSDADLPPWLEEGLAEYFSNAQIGPDSINIRPVREHTILLRRRAGPPLEAVFAATPNSEVALARTFYAQSWGVVDYLMRWRGDRFENFLVDIEGGMTTPVALKKHFDLEPVDIARSLRGTRGLPEGPMKVPIVKPERQLVTVEPLSESAMLHELGLFLGSMEATRDDAERYLEGATAADPKQARSVAAIGILRARDRRYADATPYFERAIAIDANDAEAHLLYAEALLQNAVGPFAGAIELDAEAPARFRKARTLAETARRLGGDGGRVDAIVGTTYLVEDDVREGIATLERADTSRKDVALNLYALYLRSGNRTKADALYARHFERAPDAQVKLAAHSVFVREQLARVNRLAFADKLEEAAAVMDEMIERTSDKTARAELEVERERLLRTAAVNTHIRSYNEAIKLANKGQNREALQMIEDLLLVAEDARVVKDAETLRVELRGRLKK